MRTQWKRPLAGGLHAVSACLLIGMVSASPVHAGPTLALQAEARAKLANDEMRVVLAAERDGPNPGPLNDAVLQSLNEAIERARGVDGVRTRVGGLSTQPLFGPQGKPAGYRVRGEVVLESTRFAELGALAGVLAQRLQLAGIGFGLSAARRAREEERLLGEAAAAFRSRAAAAAQAFAYKDYELKTLSLAAPGYRGPRPIGPAMAPDMAVRAAAPVPVEGGDSEIVVEVSGTVELR